MSVLQTLLAMRAEGKSEAECMTFLNAMHPPRAEYDGPRFHCRLCRDTGHLEVAHPRFVQAYQAGGIEQARLCKYRTASIRCDCIRGPRGEKDPCAIYRPMAHCEVFGGDTTSAEWWERFEHWYAEAERTSQEAFDRRHEWKPEQREFAQ